MKRVVVVALVIILLGQLCLFVAPFGSVEAEEFRGNVRVDSNRKEGVTSYAPSMVADNGNIYIVWHDTRNGDADVFYSKSSNQGVSFLVNVQINDNFGDGTYQQAPDVAAHNGAVYVVWEDGRAGPGSREIYFSKSENGFTFENNVRVSGGLTQETNPSIAVDKASGIIYVAWASNREVIRLARSLDDGETFETHVTVSDLRLYKRDHPDVAVDSTGKVFVAWSDERLGLPPYPRYNVFVANSTNDGLTFGANTPVNEVVTNAKQFNASLSIDDNDALHIVWEDERNGNMDIYYSRSTDGFGFSQNVIVNDPYYHPRKPSITHTAPSIAVHGSGNPIYVAWTDDRAGNHSVYMAESTDGGISFHTATEAAGGNYFFDGNYTFNGGRNSNEAVVLDNDNGILDPGVLNGIDSPDKIVFPGQANLQEDLTGYRLRYCDVDGNMMWDVGEDIVVDAGLDGGVILYPRVRPLQVNPADNTTGNSVPYLRWDLRRSDSMYYVVETSERMVIGWFNIAGAVDESGNPDLTGLKPGDPISGVRLQFAYKTDNGYDGSNQLTWSESLGLEHPFFQIVDTADVEVYEIADLYASGVDSVEKLQKLNISFVNDATSALNVSFNSMWLTIERGLPDGYDIYDYLIYNGLTNTPMGFPLTDFSDQDDLMFIDGSGNGFYDRGEPLVVSVGDVDPGGPINETFEVLPRGDDVHWDAVMEPFPLNDDLDNSWQENPSVAIDSSGEVYAVWRDRRFWPLSDAIFFTTTALDFIPPEVIQCIPPDGTTEVRLDSYITFIFSEPMQSDTTSYVSISPGITGLWTWNWDKTNLTFIPNGHLHDNTTYEFSISGGKDRSGNWIQSTFSCSFKTVEGPAVLHTPPQGVGAGETIDVVATISDNDSVMDATIFYVNIGETSASEAVMVLDSGSPVSGVWKGQIPAQPLMGFLSYHIVASDGVGNTGRSPSTGEHTLIIGDNVPPTIHHDVIKSGTAGRELTFVVTSTDNIDVLVVQLYIKPVGSDRFNPPITMDRIGFGDEFETTVSLPSVDGKMYYYIEATDTWGNTVSYGNASSPYKVTVTGTPIDVMAVLVWGALFIAIGLTYAVLLIHYRRHEVEEEEDEETDLIEEEVD